MTIPEANQMERQRRSEMWDAVQRIQQERPLKADEVREIGCYNGARGIWRDKTSTAHLTESGNGGGVPWSGVNPEARDLIGDQ